MSSCPQSQDGSCCGFCYNFIFLGYNMVERNTNSMGVDLTQDPNDFMNLALGKTEVTEEAAVKDPVESAAETPALPAQVAPQDNAEKTADEQKTVEETIPAPITPNAEKLSADEFRQKEAAKIIQRQGEERKRAMLAHVEATKANPDHIHTIAKFDKKLANEVIKDVWGYQDYDEMLAQSKIAELKVSDPDRGALEERLLLLEMDAKRQSSSAKEQLEKSFFVSKGFTPTEFDPRYVGVMAKLQLLNPAFVASDYSGALAEAYRMATGETIVDVKKDLLQDALNKSTPSSAPTSIKQPHSTTQSYGQGADTFANLMGVKLS